MKNIIESKSICTWSDAYGVLCFQNINNLTINRYRTQDKAILKFNNCMKYGAFDVPDNPDNRFLSDNGRLITCTLTVGNPNVTYSGTTIDPSYTYTVWDPDPNPAHVDIIASGTITNITSSTFTLATAPSNFTGTITYQLGIISDCRVENNYSKIAHCGNMMQFNFCRNISINNLELDGNIENAIIGGGGTSDGIQHPYDGILINASNDITIRNVDEHHFGHDGLWLRYVDCDFPITASMDDMNCNVINSRFQYNGRNALSWTGGRNLTCFNSEFSFSGQSRIISQPGAGIDIEFEPYASSPVSYAQENSNGIFRNCRFRYNGYHGFISDGGRGTRWTSNDYQFFNCTFVSGESVDCIWPNVAGCFFSECGFYGLCQQPFSNSTSWTNFNPDNDCIFENCYFGEVYKDRDPLSPIECFGLHSFSSTASETVFSNGAWIPDVTICPPHAPQINFSNAQRVQFRGGLTVQEFSNKVMMLGTGSTSTPFDDWNTIDGTIFTSAGMNFCSCLGTSPSPCPSVTSHESDQLLFNNTIIGLGDVFFRYITPYRWTTAPTCCPWVSPFVWAGSNIAINVSGVFGQLYSQGYSYNTPDPSPFPTAQEGVVPKFLNLNDPHTAMPLYQSPCLITPAFIPSLCSSPLRSRQFAKETKSPSLLIIPNVTAEKIVIESNQGNDICQIYSSLGVLVYEGIYVNYSKQLDLSNLKAGFYIVRSSSGASAKFIKY